MRVRLLLAALLVSGCSGLAAPEPQGPLTGDALLEALRDGGLVLYLRHTETGSTGADDLSTLGDCSRQRSLTDAGRQDARDLGAAVRELGVPVAEVRASPFCRTLETARLAFGEVVEDERLLAQAPDASDRETLRAGVSELLTRQPPDGENTVLVGHVSNVQTVAEVEPSEGGTVVFRPDGDGFRLVAEVPPGGWQRLAERS